jgi:hypothetical protein
VYNTQNLADGTYDEVCGRAVQVDPEGGGRFEVEFFGSMDS